MNTTPRRCKKATAPAAVGLPTVVQTIALALAKAEYHLRELLVIRCNDEQWDESDVDVDNATELALLQVQRMKTMELQSYEDFDTPWFLAAAAVNLAEKVFSRKDCYYARALASTVEMFRVMPNTVELVSLAKLPITEAA